MNIRPLTDSELEQIKTAKDVANNRLTEMRQTLRKQRKALSKVELTNLENRLAYLWPTKGKPVTLTLDDESICIDYEILLKFTKSLNRHKFHYWFKMTGTEGIDRQLVIRYEKRLRGGMVALNELPARQRDLLQGLPKISISGAEGEG